MVRVYSEVYGFFAGNLEFANLTPRGKAIVTAINGRENNDLFEEAEELGEAAGVEDAGEILGRPFKPIGTPLKSVWPRLSIPEL